MAQRFAPRRRVEVSVGKSRCKSVDPNQQAGTVRRFSCLADESGGARSGVCFALGGNGIFEIDDQRVGAARHRFIELFCIVCRDKKQRAHQRGRMRMNT